MFTSRHASHPVNIRSKWYSIGSTGTWHSNGSAIGSTSHSAVSSPAPSVSSLPPPNLRFLPQHTAPLQPPPPESVLNPDELVWDRDATRGTFRVQCPKCGKWIGTGSNQRSTGSLVNHMRSMVKCRVLSQLDLEFGRARIARIASFPVSTGGPSSQRSIRAQSAPPAPSVHVEFDVTTPSKFQNRKYALSHDDSSDIDMDSPPPSPSANLSCEDTGLPLHFPAGVPTNTSNDTLVDHLSEPSASQPELPKEPAINSVECPGIHLDWPTGEFWSQYPFHRHGYSLHSLGYKFCAVEKNGAYFRVRADRCNRIPMSDGTACPECRGVTKTVERLASMAQGVASHTNYKYLNHQQLCGLLAARDETLKEWKLKALNLGRKCASVLRKLDDCKRFVMALATDDIPRLHQLIRQGLKEGAGISAIINKIEQALSGVYHARGYDDLDYDIALLVLRLGGRKLLYALNQHISIPSIRALRHVRVFTQLMPSIGTPKLSDILFNIRSVFASKIDALDGARPFRTGMSIFWDEVNEEDVACYFPHQDSVGGLCREHSHSVNVRITNFDNAVTVARALADGTVHYGKEASVIALGSFGTILRGAFPVLVSPTCKQESPSESATLVQLVVSTWKEYGEQYFGPIWSFASDGDAGRRAMVYQLFMKHPIHATHKLFKYLSRLPGLNLLTGDGDITADFDWKHEIKRIGRLMRTNEGMVVGRTIINFETLRHHLSRHGSLTTEAVDKLMRPEDSQDVPRAIDFIEAVASVGKSPLDVENCNPTELQELRVIGVIGEMFSAFLYPFIQPDWNLTQQLTSLSAYAHISFALFREFRVNFMPYQLYGDTQTTIKNIIICIAKQQEMDGDQPFYLFWTGDDRLEVLFGRTRMQGGHNPNFTFKQLLDRLAAAMDLDAIFTRNPHLDQGHRRLKVTRTEKADHLNPESWTGNVTANSVDLTSAWRNGRTFALDVLEKIHIRPDFDSLFDPERCLDMLKPFGDGKYPGVSTEPDRSLEPDLPAATSATTPNHELSTSPDEADNVQLASPTEGDSGGRLHEATLEDVLDDVQDLPLAPNIENPSAWIEHEGRKIHKTSLCRLVINPDYIRKSHERPLRIRNYTCDSKPRNWNSDNIIDADAFIVGDLFATLICCNNTVALAVLKAIAINEKGVRVDRVRGQSLPHSAGGIKLTGQILDMRMVPSINRLTTSETETGTSNVTATTNTPHSWIWNGSFVKLELDQTNPSPVSKAARKTIALTISSTVCEPVNANVAKADSRLPSGDCEELNDADLTWELSDNELALVSTKVWEMVKETNALELLPRFRINSTFPYRDSRREHMALISEEGSRILEASRVSSSQKFRCYQCLVELDPKRARAHIGQHILKSIRGVPENCAGEPVGTEMPCGFCGRSGITSCSEVFLTKGSHPQAQTNCRHARKFHYQPSLKSTDSTASTNVPILCEIPGCTGQVGEHLTAVWKYNMPEHIRIKHPGYSVDGFEDGAPLPNSLIHTMFITQEEEERIGIPKDRIPTKFPPPPLVETAPSRGTKRARPGGTGTQASKRGRRR